MRMVSYKKLGRICTFEGCNRTRQRIPVRYYHKAKSNGATLREKFCRFHMDPDNRITPEERRKRLIEAHHSL